jgi:hypothetical protein
MAQSATFSGLEQIQKLVKPLQTLGESAQQNKLTWACFHHTENRTIFSRGQGRGGEQARRRPADFLGGEAEQTRGLRSVDFGGGFGYFSLASWAMEFACRLLPENHLTVLPGLMTPPFVCVERPIRVGVFHF